MSALTAPASFTPTGGLNIALDAALADQVGGRSFTSDGRLRVTTTIPSQITWVHGLPFNDSGELMVVDSNSAASPKYVANGVLIDANGAVVCVSEQAAVLPTTEAQGLKFDANGAILVEGLLFDLNFMVGVLDPRLSFSRASNATMFDSLGRLVWAPHNLFQHSADPANWPVSGVTVVRNDINGPIAGTTVGDVYDTLVSNVHTLNFNAVANTYFSGQSVTYSVYLKVGTLRYALIAFASSFNLASIGVDLIDGTLIAGTGAFTSQSITNAGGGWWRVVLTAVATGTAAVTGTFLTHCSLDGQWANRVYLGTGTGYIRVSSPVVELTDAATPRAFNPTTGANAYYGPRFDVDSQTLQPAGLLFEPQSTNLQPTSMGTPGVWPTVFGTVTDTGATITGCQAFTFTTTSTGSPQFCYPPWPSAAFAPSTLMTSSIRVKRGNHPRVQLTVANNHFLPATADAYVNYNFDTDTLTVAGSSSPAPTATRRLCADGSVILSLSYTTGTAPVVGSTALISCVDSDTAVRVAGTATNGATVHFMGAQVEVGGVATTYIPTIGASATRAADVCDLIPDCPWNPLGTTVYAAFSRYAIPPANTNSAVCFFGTSTDYVSIKMGYGTPSQQRVDMYLAGAPEAQISQSNGVAGTVYKMAGRLAPNDARLGQNGALGTLDTTVGMLPSLSSARKAVGRENSTGSNTQFYGHLRNLRVYTRALDDATLQALTT